MSTVRWRQHVPHVDATVQTRSVQLVVSYQRTANITLANTVAMRHGIMFASYPILGSA